MSSDGAVTQQAIYAHQTFSTRTDSGAVFGRLTTHVTDTFRVVGGVRYTRDKKKFDGLADGLVLVCTDSAAGVYMCPTRSCWASPARRRSRLSTASRCRPKLGRRSRRPAMARC